MNEGMYLKGVGSIQVLNQGVKRQMIDEYWLNIIIICVFRSQNTDILDLVKLPRLKYIFTYYIQMTHNLKTYILIAASRGELQEASGRKDLTAPLLLLLRRQLRV